MKIVRKQKRLAVAAAIVLGSAFASIGIAQADGMGPRGRVVYEQPWNWSGLYFGAHLGYAWSEFDAAFVSGIPNYTVNPDVGIYGGQIGLQHQFGKLVLGIEGSASGSIHRAYDSTDCPPPNNLAFTCAARLRDVLSVGPRVGWAMGKWMPYITGGYASANFTEKFTIKAAPSNPFTDSNRHEGWYIGGGGDLALSHGWMIGLEYRHYDFDSARYAPTRITGGLPDPLGGAENHADARVDTLAVRLSWKFGWDERRYAPLK